MARRSVVIEVRAGESLQLTAPPHGTQTTAQTITVALERKAGQRARLRITAEDKVLIHRTEPARETA